jgi:hypothetical protein
MNYLATILASKLLSLLVTTPLLRRSITTTIFVHPSNLGRSVIKSIEISNHIWFGISRGFKNPRLFIHYDLFRP